MKNIFLMLLPATFLLSCLPSKTKSEYELTLDFFNDTLINHFPKHEPYKVNIYEHLDTNAYHNTVSYRYTVCNSKGIIDSVLTKYGNNIIAEYSSNDSCLLVINDFIDISNASDSFRGAKSSFIDSCIGIYPVPNFWSDELATNSTKCKLPKDFIFYILDSKVGMYSKKINKEQSSMPDAIKHGYSKGIAISEKRSTIIYWVIVW